MKTGKRTLHILAVTIVCLFSASVAQAQATRTWVSGVGDDANPCSRTAPCKTFAGAISKTAAGGEINCLDPAGFGAVTITKSITIACTTSGEGGVLVSGTNGIIINNSTAKVILRGLSINGGGTGGLNGINFISGSSLVVEDTKINNMAVGINIVPATPTNSEILIRNTHIRDNSSVGIFVANSGGGIADVAIEKSTVVNNNFGVLGRNNARVTMRESVVSGNTTTGVLAELLAGGGTGEINVDSCIITNNGTGLSGGSSGSPNQGIIRASNNFISRNGTGVAVGNGQVLTFGDNKLQGNTANGAFTAGTLGKN